MLRQSKNQVDIWHIAGDSKDHQQYVPYLTAQELQQSYQFVFEQDQHLSILTRAYIKIVIAKYIDISPNEISFIKSEYGKPQVNQAICKTPIEFNISHTNGHIVIAISQNTPVGIDIEMKRESNGVDIAKRFFNKKEVEHLLNSPEETQITEFIRIWTLKEAALKTIGLGISNEMDNFDVTAALFSPTSIQVGKQKAPVFLQELCLGKSIFSALGTTLESPTIKYFAE